MARARAEGVARCGAHVGREEPLGPRGEAIQLRFERRARLGTLNALLRGEQVAVDRERPAVGLERRLPALLALGTLRRRQVRRDACIALRARDLRQPVLHLGGARDGYCRRAETPPAPR